MNDHAVREAAIVNTALDLAEERGVVGVTTAALARRLHFTEAALYRYFPGKGAIIAAALRNMAERLFATMLLELMPEAISQGQTVPPQLQRHLHRFGLRKGLLLELVLYASGTRDEALQAAGGEFLQEYGQRMTAYFQQLHDLHVTNSPAPAEELSRLWVCQVLGGFMHSRLTREAWDPVEQPGFQAFTARLQSSGSLAAS
jgi:AcrR family transcriptional regulator